MFKNMKIEINEEQPLDEVVKELERLGFYKGSWWTKVLTQVIEACASTMQLVNYSDSDIQIRTGDLVTLAELKEM